jgi:hypothetical protein
MSISSSEAYFDLQLQFAERYSKLTDVPLPDAIGKCTNLRRRFGLWCPKGDRAWAAFLEELSSCRQHRDLLRLTLSVAGSAPTFRQSPFGCFSYDPGGADKPLRLHFMPDLRHRHSGPLASSSRHERHAELQALFAEVRQQHPEVQQVLGFSWLYHTHAYKRLFPPAYVESLVPAEGPHHLNGSSIWGQVLNHRHELKPGVADLVLDGLQPRIVDSPWRAFALQPLVAYCSVEHFFNWFAVE